MTCISRFLPALLVLLSLTTQAEPDAVPRLASQARLFLRVPDSSPPLRDIRFPDGQIQSANWEATPEKRARLTDLTAAIDWWRWKDYTLSFTPAHDGTVELDLNGMWAQEKPGILQQQEVLWDDVRAEGSKVENGDFEQLESSLPTSWKSPWRPYPATDQWPFNQKIPAAAGSHYAASWHGRPLTQSIPVRSGQTVTLHFRARAATPADFKGLTRLSGTTPAHATNAQLHKGINLGNHWEAPPGTWGIHYDTTDLDRIAAEGFDHIRVPVAWHYRLEDDRINPAFLQEVDTLLKHALSCKLRVILNWHHFDEICRNPVAERERFLKGWRLLAEHYRSWPPGLLFEVLNEPNQELDGEALSSLYTSTLKVIRESNPTRTILVSPSQWAGIQALSRLNLPESDHNLIVSVHCYDPFPFTHQGANWVNLTEWKNIRYPGPPASPTTLPDSALTQPDRKSWFEAYLGQPTDQNPCTSRAFESQLDHALAWSQHFGRPIHLGEFGVYQTADPESRQRYARDFRLAAEKRQIPWTWWEWKAGFGYWDPKTQKPLLRAAFFNP